MKRLSSVSFFVFTTFLAVSFVPLSNASSQEVMTKKKCLLIEQEELLKSYNDELFRLKTMYIFDIRPYQTARKGRQIVGSRMISYANLETDSMYTIKWKGKSTYLFGKDTESVEKFCGVMIKKDFIVENIYILKGGINAWNGPVMRKFEDVKCEALTYHEVTNIINAGRKVEIFDWRPRETYNNGHIAGAVRGDHVNADRLYLNERAPYWAELRDKNGIVIFIGNNEQDATHRCRLAKRGGGSIDDMVYVLRGNMKGWEGELEKEMMPLKEENL